jgi:putative flippase GtrA
LPTNATPRKKNRLVKILLRQLFTFTKAQIAAFSGGIVDYLAMIAITEFAGIHYAYSIVISGIIGAYVNFKVNKGWTFQSSESAYHSSTQVQLIKFSLVVLNSVLLKAAGTYLITTYIKTDYYISRLIVDAVVSLIFNYNLQKYWVFRKKKQRT